MAKIPDKEYGKQTRSTFAFPNIKESIPSIERQEKKIIMIEEKHFFCSRPFTFIEVRNDGNVYPCCIGWTEYPFGSWEKQSFEEIWNGEQAKQFRRSILDSSYRFCKLKRCLHYGDQNMFFTQQETKKFKEVCPPPETVDFSHEKVCNVRCVMCRDDHIRNEKEKTKELDERIKRVFLPMVANARFVIINGEGEALASAHCRKLIKAIAEKYPLVKFDLRTNGVLADKKNFESLGLIGRIRHVFISLHAVTNKTYDKIVLDSDFNRIMNNIKWLDSIKNKGSIDGFDLIMVVSALNYREMIPFLKFAQKYKTAATFLEYFNWGTKMGEQYGKMAVFKEWHFHYNKYVRISSKIMTDRNLKKSLKLISPLLINLNPVSTGRWIKYRIEDMMNWLKKRRFICF
jgi:radical SAM protein with 4Fe4S-binding SPASM domain